MRNLYYFTILIISFLFQYIKSSISDIRLLPNGSGNSYNNNFKDKNNICPSLTDCYNCTIYSDQMTTCGWSDRQCNSILYSNELNSKWWRYFDECLIDVNAEETMLTYCGSTTMFIPFTVGLLNVNGLFGVPNLYCSWEVDNIQTSKQLSLNFTNMAFSYNMDSTLVMELFYQNGQKQYQVMNFRVLNWLVAEGIQSIHFHYFTTQSYNMKPFEITLSLNHDSIGYIGLIASITSIVSSCLVCTLLFYRCTRRILQRRLELNHIGVLNNLEGRSDAEMVRYLNEILTNLLETELKPVKYTEQMNKFNNNCTICLEDFNTASEVIVLECNHIFHFMCLKNWLNKNILNPKCPNCNYNVLLKKHVLDNQIPVQIVEAPVVNNNTVIRNVYTSVANNIPVAYPAQVIALEMRPDNENLEAVRNNYLGGITSRDNPV